MRWLRWWKPWPVALVTDPEPEFTVAPWHALRHGDAVFGRGGPYVVHSATPSTIILIR